MIRAPTGGSGQGPWPTRRSAPESKPSAARRADSVAGATETHLVSRAGPGQFLPGLPDLGVASLAGQR